MAERRHSVFRPCIDLHDGQVKQIVGGTLSDKTPNGLQTNFVSSKSPAEFARLYKEHDLRGGHVIKLGPGNDDAAREALNAWPGLVILGNSFNSQRGSSVCFFTPGGLQIGGGITDSNAKSWIDAGASKVIVTSYLFPNAKFSLERLQDISSAVEKERLVVDVSCRRRGEQWVVAMNKWQDLTDMEVSRETLELLSEYCSEFLIHAADVEGLCQGIDEALVTKLGEWCQIPVTYAGGAKGRITLLSLRSEAGEMFADISDLDLVDRLSNGRVDLTYGRFASSLDIFGARGFGFCASGNRRTDTRIFYENKVRQKFKSTTKGRNAGHCRSKLYSYITNLNSRPHKANHSKLSKLCTSTSSRPAKMPGKVKAYELQSKSKNDLNKQLLELKNELLQLRVQKIAGGSASKLTKINTVRKSIARVMTVMNQKARQNLREYYKNKKYLPLDLRPKRTRAIRRRLTKHEKSLKTLKQKKKNQNFPLRKYAVKA
ncbi:hypothetical protein D9758_001050 [Tetrapyrgos nigripes]|uniref:1-(5-phosphoribosyl)-5-[(5-phosphoribosylamino)methylideneamino] imidazole-4-carboxamide isomerase n=1 Tax=Tetrapyrgos nigripes TaxID=182062 RepID=A0A8H5LUE8_9AGAR|nr:hypothetical protein D9758_001050 [Tetrapyrgos nigripes]